MTFVRTGDAGRTVDFCFEGRRIEAREGDSVAAALLAAGVDRVRSTTNGGSPRLPYCLMGVCFECLVEIDGEANLQSCMVEVKAGMKVKRQELGREELP